MNKTISIAVVIVVSLIIVAILFAVNMPYKQRARAEASLDAYLVSLNISSTNSICNKDSDGDGYSSCAYNNGKKIINIECDSALIFNSASCKKPKNMFTE